MVRLRATRTGAAYGVGGLLAGVADGVGHERREKENRAHRKRSDVDLAVTGDVEVLRAECIAAELDELPLPYRFEVQPLARIRYLPSGERATVFLADAPPAGPHHIFCVPRGSGVVRIPGFPSLRPCLPNPPTRTFPVRGHPSSGSRT